jgi:tRNA threonylcarbamoyladenosine biosynthesis protein TsaE
MTKTFQIKTQQEMAEFAKDFAKNLNATFRIQKVICLSGTLGAGKTFFAKEFIGALLQEKQEITSPTFNLLNVYDSIVGEIYHFDLYRLKSADELENIGFFDAIAQTSVLGNSSESGPPLFKGFEREENDSNNHFQRERADALAQRGGLNNNNICLIEWPDIAKKYLKNYIEIEIAITNSEEREVKVTNV